jgi:phage tail sheath protein FI
MPISPTYPGVYVEEIPSGVRTITGVATSITAFLGRAPRGPDDPTLLTSWADFERQFGGLAVTYPMSYAVRDFFQNGGSTALIVRLYKAQDAGTGIAAFDLPSGTPKLTLEATSPGSWGNKLRITVDTNVAAEVKTALGLAAGDDLFNLTVRDAGPGGTTEKFLNLTTKVSSRRIDQVLAAESNLLAWKGTYPATAPTGIVAGSAGAGQQEQGVADAVKTLQDAKNKLNADPNYAKAKDDLAAAQKKLADDTAANQPQNVLDADNAAITAAQAGLDAVVKPVADATKAVDTAQQALATGESGLGGKDSAPLDQATYQGKEVDRTGIYALLSADLFNLLSIPPDTRDGDTPAAVFQSAMQFCAGHRAMLLVDSPFAWGANASTAATKAKDGLDTLGLTGVAARNAALYFPRVSVSDPLQEGRVDTFVASGMIAGIMARTDTQRGVWKAPAGMDSALGTTAGLQVVLNDPDNGVLNPLGINCLRAFPVYGRVVWGSRTLRGADQLADEYKYVPVRRLALFIEESLFRGTKWVVFEPNDEPLWAQIRLNIGAFMHNLFRQGAFQGTTPRDAYFVKCDSETTTQNDINLGIVNIVVGFAPLKPAEFVIIKLQQIAGKIEV